MAKRRTSRPAARRRPGRVQPRTLQWLDRRRLRYEPLEDRRLLALVTVDSLSDTVDFNDGLTSLREAIFATNLVGGADTIEFAPSLTAGGPATILLTQGELRITDDLTINGPGADLLAIDASGNDPTPDINNGDGSRVFRMDDGNGANAIVVTLNGLTLTGGDVTGDGGAILSREQLSLAGTTIRDSSAASADGSSLSHGGAIAHSGGALQIDRSMIAGNSADAGAGIYLHDGTLHVNGTQITGNVGLSGAGVYINAGDASIIGSAISENRADSAFALGGGIYTLGNLTITASTVSDNRAAYGGGIFSATDPGFFESTRIVNSTVSGNTAFVRGGGVRNAAGLTVIEHCTITDNEAPAGQGSGVASRGYDTARTAVFSTIIAGNTNSDVDFKTGQINSFLSNGYNLVGTGNALAEFQEAGDQTGVINPLLGPLADNGGPTLPDGSKLLAHALLPDSPAINAGDPSAMAGAGGVPLFDQRGEPFGRVFNGRIDIGAFERQPNPLPGDYNFDGTVDLADYVVWRDTLGSLSDLRADDNEDGTVDAADWTVWRANFGRTRQSMEQGAAGREPELGFREVNAAPRAEYTPPKRNALHDPAPDLSALQTSAIDQFFDTLAARNARLLLYLV